MHATLAHATCVSWMLMLVLAQPVMADNLQTDRTRPNVLLIAVDDLNDWVGCLAGHPQAHTPNLDALAAAGVLFANAHCQAPVCMPSRASLMTSLLPSTSGLYFLNPGIAQSPAAAKVKTLPERFADEGYAVMGAGKLFHHQTNQRVFSRVGVYGEFTNIQIGFGPRPKNKISQPHGHPLWDWGAFPEHDRLMPDNHLAKWAADRLQENHGKPFFLAVGFYRPHVPMYVPQRWFDQHPRQSVKLPQIKSDDVNDLPMYARDLTSLHHVAPTHEWMEQSGQWPHAVQSYLASVTFVDDCVGTVINALENSGYRDNTIVVLFSDHGFHLGEKRRWAKRSLWEDATRVPLIISGPGIGPKSVSNRPVGLIDIYPTLLDLCGLEPDSGHEGNSLSTLLHDPNQDWDVPAITTFGPGNHAVRSTRWRYICYRDGSQELYDHQRDPHEWNNLASDPAVADVIAEHAKWLPKTEHAVLGKDSTGHRAFDAANAKLNSDK